MSRGTRLDTTSRARVRRVLRWTREAALTVAALAGVTTVVVIVVCAALQVRPLVFMSGSMRPTIDAGALAFAQRTPIDELKRGDIVSVVTDEGSRVTHRLVAIDRTGVAPALRLKGDANPIEDRDPYIVPSADRVLFSVPHLGRGMGFISSPWGLFLLGVGVTGLLVYAFRPGLRRRGTRALALAVVPVAMALAFSNSSTPTFAWFTDTGTVRGAASTASVQSNAQPNCQDVNGLIIVGNVARLTWTQVDARYVYFWELRRLSTNALETSGTVGAATAQGATIALDITSAMAASNTNYNVIIRARLSNASGWVAANTTTTPVRRQLVAIIGSAFRCGHAF